MLRHSFIAIAAVALLAGCVEGRPSGPDRDPPRITLTLLDGTGTPHFDTDESDDNPVDACGSARAFPATVSVAVGDSGGIDFVNIRVFPSELMPTSISVAPAAPETSFEVSRDRATDVLVVTVRPPGADLVRTGVLTTFDVADFSAILVTAFDVAGNSNELYQVDIRGREDPIICRND